ncbi:MAG: TetR/AcrR family transcriptional regulator [Pseudomonadota bacterium]
MTDHNAVDDQAPCPDAPADDLFPHGEPFDPCGKSAGRPRTADMEARLHNLLGHATRLFLEKGYSNVSLETIAREAHVAVRTIYVKFGGKAGLLNAAVASVRERYFSTMADMDTDPRPIDQILSDFGQRHIELVSMPSAVRMHRMVVSEASTNPALVDSFYAAGPGQSREALSRFFSRPEVRPLFRAELSAEVLTSHLLNCIMGDHGKRLLFDPPNPPTEAELHAKVTLGLGLFFRGCLRAPDLR